MKALLSMLLGLILLTSLVGISYATNNNSCGQMSPNDPNYVSLGCAGAAHQGGNENPPEHFCFVSKNAPDGSCRCPNSITPNGLEVSDIQPDVC